MLFLPSQFVRCLLGNCVCKRREIAKRQKTRKIKEFPLVHGHNVCAGEKRILRSKARNGGPKVTAPPYCVPCPALPWCTRSASLELIKYIKYNGNVLIKNKGRKARTTAAAVACATGN